MFAHIRVPVKLLNSVVGMAGTVGIPIPTLDMNLTTSMVSYPT